jgi:hypothetical protein
MYQIYFSDYSLKKLEIGQNQNKFLASRRTFQNKIDCIIYAKDLAEANGLKYEDSSRNV